MNNKTTTKIILVGVGGTGSYLVPPLLSMLSQKWAPNLKELIMIDRDTLVEGNLARQLFPNALPGTPKVAALGDIHQIMIQKLGEEGIEVTTIPKFFSPTLSDELSLDVDTMIVSCVDNHPTRKWILAACDQFGCSAILSGNKKWIGDAMFYTPDFKGSNKDPRIRYPEILTEETDNPLTPSCAELAIVQTADGEEEVEQTAGANFISASFVIQLLLVYVFFPPHELAGMSMDELPYEFRSTKLRNITL